MTEALVGLGLMMVLALLRIPIAISMGLIGFLGVAYMRDWNFAPAMAMVETKVYETGRNYTLSVISAAGLRWRRWWPVPASVRSADRRLRPPRPWRRSPIPR